MWVRVVHHSYCCQFFVCTNFHGINFCGEAGPQKLVPVKNFRVYGMRIILWSDHYQDEVSAMMLHVAPFIHLLHHLDLSVFHLMLTMKFVLLLHCEYLKLKRKLFYFPQKENTLFYSYYMCFTAISKQKKSGCSKNTVSLVTVCYLQGKHMCHKMYSIEQTLAIAMHSTAPLKLSCPIIS